MLRRGITPVVAIALLLGMTVAASGGAYAWVTTTTAQAQDEASQGLATRVEARAVACGAGVVDIGVSNAGDTAVDASEAELYVEDGGDLVSGRTGVDTGTGTLEPGDFHRYRFVADAAMETGTRYSVELRFPHDGAAVTGTCDGGAAAVLDGWWRMDENTTITDGFEGGADGNSIPGVTRWVTDELALEYDDSTAAEGTLSAYTTSLDADSPLMHRPFFDRERNISHFTAWYRETGSSHGHGVTLRDSNRNRIMGWYTNNPEFGVYDSSGFDGGQSSGSLISGLSYGTWYQVNVSLDWNSQEFTVIHSGNTSKTLGPYTMDGSPQYLYMENMNKENTWDWQGDDVRSWIDGIRFQTDVTDYSGSANIVFPVSRNENPVWDMSCRSGGCFDFDGDEEYLYAPDGASVDQPGNFTVSAWVRPDDIASGGVVLEKGDSPGANYRIGLNPDGVGPERVAYAFYEDADGDNHKVDGTTQLEDGVWHHLAVSWNGTHLAVFVDGEREGVQAQGSPPATNDGRLTIGVDAAENYFFDGRIDEVAVAPHALR